METFTIRQLDFSYPNMKKKALKKIDLSINDTYSVKGFNGEVIIEVNNNKLRVKKEDSPLHICSKQGFTNKGSIVCLPNKIVINFKNNELDAIVG